MSSAPTTLSPLPAEPRAELEAMAPRPPSVLRRLRRDRFAVAGAIGLVVMLIVALIAPLVASWTGHPPNTSFVSQGLDVNGLPKGPNGDFLFGSDLAGRDVFVRTFYGARTALVIGLVATSLSMIIGVTIGLLAGYLGGIADTILSRVIELFFVLPVLVLALGLASACGGPEGCVGGAVRPGVPFVCLVIGLSTWPYTARVVRAEALALRDREFIAAARLMGFGPTRILVREVLPNILPTVIVLTVILMPGIILYEAALAFLGIGSSETVSWGNLLGQARQVFPAGWWLLLFPGLFLSLTVFAANLLGEGIGDALDPKHTTDVAGGHA
ncbi:MAG: ABC transporter permease [Conexibacter sp.]